MVEEKLTDSKMKETGPKKSVKEKKISIESDKMELNETTEIRGKVEAKKGKEKPKKGTEGMEEAQKKNDKMEVNEKTSKDEKEAAEPKKEDETPVSSGPSKRCNKEATEPLGKPKINVIDSKNKGGRGLTEWEAANLHLELKGEKGRLRPFERKNPRRVTYILRKNEVIIGRSETCDIKFQEVKGMGDKHCKITFTADGRAFLHPLYMSGLTYLNGEMIRSRKTLTHNDIITAVKVSYRFTYPDSSKHSLRGKCADSKKAKEKDDEKYKPDEDKKVPEKLSNGKNSEKMPVKGQNVQKKSSEVKQSGKKHDEKKPIEKKKSDGGKSGGGKPQPKNSGQTTEADILKRFPDINNTRKQIAEIMELLDETQSCAEDLEQSLKDCNIPRINDLFHYLDSDDDFSNDETIDISDILGDDPASETWERFLEKEITEALRKNSNRLGQTSLGKKIKIYKKRDANGRIATTNNSYQNPVERLTDIDSDESSGDEDDDVFEDDNELEEANAIYIELLQCLRNYYRNKRSLSRISTLMFYLDIAYKNMGSFNRIRCPSWIRRTRDHREIVESARECKESLKRMYRKFKADRYRIEREPFGQLDPVRTLQSAQEFQREPPRRKLIARRKRCDKTVQTVAGNKM